MLIGYIREGRSTQNYAKGEAAYLQDALRRDAEKLQQQTAAPGTEAAFHEYARELALLTRELASIGPEIEQPDSLNSSRERIGEIGKRLKALNTDLSGAPPL